jgi:hypothetical protein
MSTITLTLQTMTPNCNPDFSILQDYGDFRKPFICVTPADDAVHENFNDETCSSPGLLDIPYIEPLSEKSAMMNIYNIPEQPIPNSNEMYFYRTGWQNRVVHTKGDRTSKMAYYVDIPWRSRETLLTVHRGYRSGAVVAQAARHGSSRPVEITFSHPKQRHYLDNSETLKLDFGCLYSRTNEFVYRGRNLAWKDGTNTTKQLKDLDTEETIAEFHSKRGVSLHKDGKLVFMGKYARDELWVDVIVATALTCQQRDREVRQTFDHGSGEDGC